MAGFSFLGRFFWYCTQKQGALSQKKRCLSEFFLFPRCGYQATSRRPPKKNAVILSPFYSRVAGTKWQAGGPPKKNAVILSPFYSRITGTKWQAGARPKKTLSS
jgi:hypothetical protein